MKANITFRFAPEEDGSVEDAIKLRLDAPKFQSILWDFDNYLRSLIKYEDVGQMDPQVIRNKLWELIKEGDVQIS